MIFSSFSLTREAISFIKTGRHFALATVVGLWLALPARAEVVYRITDLGELPGGLNYSDAWAVSSNGHVAGFSEAATGGRAYLWTSAGGMQDLGDLPGGNDFSGAAGVNSGGDVVGYSEAASGARAFLWTSSNVMRDLGDLPGGTDFSQAFGINDSGQVVGESEAATGLRAFMWTSEGGMHDLGDLPGGRDSSRAFAINNSGQVVGVSGAAAGDHAFLWTGAGGMQDLGVLPSGGFSSVGRGINGIGHVVGDIDAIGGRRAFLWSSSSGMQDLGRLLGDNWSTASEINDSGQVVGYSVDDSTATGQRAFLWTSDGGMKNLTNMLEVAGVGWKLRRAEAINNAGQIVGYGINRDGASRAFLLTPIPAPSLLAFTEFNEPPLGASSFVRDPDDEELGFVTMVSAASGGNQLAGVANFTALGGGRGLVHRSVRATTTFDTVDLAGYDDVTISIFMRVGNTIYFSGDFVRIYVTNGADTIDLINAVGTPIIDELDTLRDDGLMRYVARIPNDWAQATLVVGSSSDSELGTEYFNFDSVEFRGVFVIPEPGTWGIALAALVAVVVGRRLGLVRTVRR